MILEGILTTINADGGTNISPMGPIVDSQMKELILRPYKTSATYENLKRTGQGVFHVTDDVELLARSAMNQIETPPKLFEAEAIEGKIIADACRWYDMRVRSIEDAQEPARIVAEVVAQGRLRDFFGFNRAKHAVVEAAILASRIEWLPAEEILADFARLGTIVEKTGGSQETAAMAFLDQLVRKTLAAPGC